MMNATLSPALSLKANAFAEHLTRFVDQLPSRRAESLPGRQAYFSGQALAEQLDRAGRARTHSGYESALSSAVAEARTAGYWLDALAHDHLEAARLHDEADDLTAALLEATY